MLVFLIILLIIFLCFDNKYVSKREFAREAYKWSRKLNKIDLQVRNCQTNDEYYQKLVNSYVSFSPQDKQLLDKYNARFVKINFREELQYAYTLSDFIVVNDEVLKLPHLDELLYHEMIHIWQRQNPKKNSQMIKDWGFEKVNLKPSNKRTNPDTDDNVYQLNGKILSFYWKDNAKNLKDYYSQEFNFPSYVLEYDHPNEVIAYTLAHKKIE